MEIWTAFILGLVGSAHCAGMCGPLALALPSAGRTRVGYAGGRLAYNGGRLITYAFLGLVFGAIGGGLALAGLQRAASIAIGGALLASLFFSSRLNLASPVVRATGALKKGLGALLGRRSWTSLFLVGILNGFLPCGLVYAACAAAAATGSVYSAAQYMAWFGLGTVPLMLAASLAGGRLQLSLRFRLQRLIPVCLALMGTLLILRGLSLGIPCVSPVLGAEGSPACH